MFWVYCQKKEIMRFIILYLFFLLPILVKAQVPVSNAPATNTTFDQDTTYQKNEKSNKKNSAPQYKSKSESYNAEPKPSQEQVKKQAYSELNSLNSSVNYQRTQRTPEPSKQQSMKEQLITLQVNAPNSFECQFFTYVVGNYNIAYGSNLLKAYEMQPSNKVLYPYLVSYYVLTKNSKKTLEFLEKMVQLNELDKDDISYNREVLHSVPENGTLITHGVDNSLSCMYLQLKEGLRKDIQIVVLDYLQGSKYKADLRANQYKLPTDTIINAHYLSEFARLNESKNIAISLTTPKEYFTSISAQIYVVGLVFEYHSKPFNNFYKNDYLWNEVLQKKNNLNVSSEKLKRLSSNYLPMLLVLKAIYEDRKELDKAAEIDKAIDLIAVSCHKEKQVNKLKSAY
jgi:hypothetical protein